jgi:hypothetical protein
MCALFIPQTDVTGETADDTGICTAGRDDDAEYCQPAKKKTRPAAKRHSAVLHRDMGINHQVCPHSNSICTLIVAAVSPCIVVLFADRFISEKSQFEANGWSVSFAIVADDEAFRGSALLLCWFTTSYNA